ncbi:speckle-type POZ protein-like [Aphidius gifuensis]|uniref:speckle-type POZ protein-like n=1 Tax=Aphidius gifuensis TaxID=684658 RepID=UPI001CDC3E2C|nr:speckle-type POZ protein-like [Aphidius gifuensis]
MAVLLADCIRLVDSCQMVTDIMKTYVFTYEWTIQNFKRLWNKTIESPSFSSHNADFADEWILKYYPSGDVQFDNRTYMSVDLQLKSFNNTSQLQTKCTISIGRENKITMKYNFRTLSEKITWDKYISSSDIFDSRNGYVQNNELKIRCTITMSKKRTNNSNVIPSFDAKQQLCVDLEKLLLSEKSADVTIQVGQKSFRAIKGILAVRSPVFAAMFDHEQFKENEKNEVVIEDIDEDVFEEFLHCIYTGESPNVDKMPMELLAVADRYQVDCLKNICEEIICGTIDFDNISSILVCSDRYNLKKLNQKCSEFMKKNLQAVLSNETFQVYKKKYPEVFVGVLEQLLKS